MSEGAPGETASAITRVVRRQDREQQWRNRVAAWKASGQTQTDYCREQKWAPADLSWWKHELARRDQTLKTENTQASKPKRAKRVFNPVPISPSPASEGFELVLRSGRPSAWARIVR